MTERHTFVIEEEREQPLGGKPSHHVSPSRKPFDIASYFSRAARQDDQNATNFQNPWPSFHKPSAKEAWDALAWGQDQDTSIELAASHSNITGDSPSDRAKQAAQLLNVENPDFSFESGQRAKSTWLGHAGMLLQLPSLSSTSQEPIRVILDPIFSQRCSPSQNIGPTRWYPPPCTIEELPSIDFVVISHNHYDHLDYNTIKRIWELQQDRVHFVVPLNMKRWFLDIAQLGIPNSAVTELDWWESVTVRPQSSAEKRLRISCCPAQHSSARVGMEENSVLWAGWYFEHDCDNSPYKVFFAGDTGFQFHASPTWPPMPPSDPRTVSTSDKPPTEKGCPADEINEQEDKRFPVCPAFAEVAQRYGSPDLLYLPIALGATYAYLRSFFSSIPDNVDPFPRHSAGMTGSVHMAPWDAVRVMRAMTEDGVKKTKKPIAIAIHWGTFTTDPLDILKTLGQLQWACNQHRIEFGRAFQSGDDREDRMFLAINQGQSIVT